MANLLETKTAMISLLAVALAVTLLTGQAIADDRGATRLSRVSATIEKFEGQKLSVDEYIGIVP
jgi:hypothetical protein